MKRLSLGLAAFALSLALAVPAMAYEAFKGPLGVLQNEPGTYEGYTLVVPQNSKTTYLVDLKGNVIQEWKSEYIGFHGVLAANGNLMRHSVIDKVAPEFGGTSGLFEEFDWTGKKVWEHKAYIPGKEVSHHVFDIMPNGNLLFLVWEYKSLEEAVAKGLKMGQPGRTLFEDGMKDRNGYSAKGIWPDLIREVDRSGKTVWEWKVWDHIGTGPDQFDINWFIPAEIGRILAGPDWTHCNGVSYNPATDKVALTSRNFGEVYVIDRKTGKMEFRWGNPNTYGQGKVSAAYGDDGDQKLYGPHAPAWTPEGNITVLDNGTSRPSSNYTRGIELDPRTSKVVYEWKAANVGASDSNFYSAFQCGVQKLPNGNYLITASANGHTVEVTPDKKIVWEFVNPMVRDQYYAVSIPTGGNMGTWGVHKMMRYGKDFAGFQGKDMTAKKSVLPAGSPDWLELLKTNVVPAPAKRP